MCVGPTQKKKMESIEVLTREYQSIIGDSWFPSSCIIFDACSSSSPQQKGLLSPDGHVSLAHYPAAAMDGIGTFGRLGN